jgi:hypothetical protein
MKRSFMQDKARSKAELYRMLSIEGRPICDGARQVLFASNEGLDNSLPIPRNDFRGDETGR